MAKKGILSWPAYLAIIGVGMIFGGVIGFDAGYVKGGGMGDNSISVTVDFFDSFGRKVTSEYRVSPGAIIYSIPRLCFVPRNSSKIKSAKNRLDF